MKTTTFYVADDGMCFADEKVCREHERKFKEKANSSLLNEYRNNHITMQHMKLACYPLMRTLPMLQDELIQLKRKYLAAKKYGVNGSKAKRFAQLAVLQYKYYCAKEELARGIALYRKLKANLCELGERLGFKGARPAGKEVAK